MREIVRRVVTLSDGCGAGLGLMGVEEDGDDVLGLGAAGSEASLQSRLSRKQRELLQPGHGAEAAEEEEEEEEEEQQQQQQHPSRHRHL